MSYGHGSRLEQLLRLGPCHVCPEPANGLVIDDARYCPPHGREAYTAQETPPMTATATRADVPRAAARTLEAAGLLLPELVSYDLTPPSYARALGAKVALVERYQPDNAWTVLQLETLEDVWVIRWDRLTIALRDRSDLELARFVVEERNRARKHLRRTVLGAARSLGLPASRFAYPATITINAGLTRCPSCRCNVRAGQHAPGSEDCHESRVERELSIAT